ncbi:MAG: hypothetical protein AAB458_01615 [Patescibacteria group bacterium]
MNTTYKPRIPSPFQVTRKPYYQKEMPQDTVRGEITKLLGTYQFSATFEEDTQTAATLKHIPGIIAFVCTIKKGDQVIGQGRGTSVINQNNRFIVRTIGYAFNASIVDAIVRSTKILDIFRPDAKPHSWGGADTPEDSFVGITDKQKSYLTELIQSNVADEDEREGWLSQLSELTKDEASQAIQRFAK